jgi:hypothetical protein
VGILIAGTAYLGLFAMAVYCAAHDILARRDRRAEAT